MVDEPGDAGVERICRWAANVGLLGRALAIGRRAGASDEDLYDVAEQHGLARTELDALFVEPVGSGQ